MKRLLLIFILCSISVGESIEQTIFLNSFNAGELSPLMNARVDFPKYRLGAKTLENMLVRVQGPIQRRPGTKYIASVKDATDETRLISFSDTNDFIVELGDYYARFFTDGAPVADVNGATHYEVDTPWDANDVFELQYAMAEGSMRLVHGDYEPYVLERPDDTNDAAWTCEPIESTTGPFLNENTDKDFTITPSSTGDTAGNDYYKLNDDHEVSVRGTSWNTQTFKASQTYTTTGVKVKLWRVGMPGTVTVSIRATSAGKPTGADLAVGTTDGDTLSDSPTGSWREITFAATTNLTSGTTYAVVLRALSGWIGNSINWRHDSSSPAYSNGSYGGSSDSGSNWIMKTSYDLMFEVVASGVNSSVTTLKASADLFDADHVGALWQISHSLPSSTAIQTFWANGTTTSSSITVQKYRYYDVFTNIGWRGTFIIQRSYDDGTNWENVYSVSYYNDGSIQFAGQELYDTCLYRMRMENQIVTSHQFRHYQGICQGNLTARGFINNGVVEITSVTDANTAIGDIKIALGSTDATWRWAEGAWSDYRGWPKTVEYHEQRIIYGNTDLSPETVWASIIAEEDSDYDDFTANTESDAEGNLGGPDDIAWTYKFPGMGAAQWIRSGKYLFVGTSKGVMMLGQPGKPITPNFPPIARMQNYNACAFLQPANAAAAILYVEKGSQKVRELGYIDTRDTYIAPDLTILAEHITGDGIVDTAFQSRDDPTLWLVRRDGSLISFTYSRDQDVHAWSRHITGD